MDSKYLFTLVPLSPETIQIVKANRRYREIYEGTECLSFRATHKSLFPGRLLSIGRQPGINDVILPGDEFALSVLIKFCLSLFETYLPTGII